MDKRKKTTESELSASQKYFVTANLFVNNKNVIRFRGHFYFWHEDSVWREESDENTRAWIATEYFRLFEIPPVKSQINEISEMINTLTYEKYRKEIKYFDDPKKNPEICMKSGILDLQTMKTKPYEMNEFKFHKLPFDYTDNPEIPIFQKFLTTTFEFPYPFNAKENQEMSDDYIKVMHFIQEFIGYTLIPSNPLHKALIMVGDGRNGKGVLINIWSFILGKENVSHVDLSGINDGSQIFMCKNKLVNFSHDLESGQQLDTGNMKAATAGETLIVKELYKPHYDIKFPAKIVIACNDLPYIKNTGAAIRERIFILPFNRYFEEHERDYELDSKLEKEASGIFSWAVKGLKRLQERGRFDPPARCTMKAIDYLKMNDSIQLWIEEEEIKNTSSSCERQEAWKAYRIFCDGSGYKAGGKKKFYEKMEKKGFHVSGRKFMNMKLPNQII